MDYAVTSPTEKVILDGTKERQGDFVFTANDVGEYRFCFNNEMSTFAEKMVDFEIAVGWPPFHPTRRLTLTAFPRSRTRTAHSSPPSKALLLNRPPYSKNPLSNCPHNYQPSRAIRNTSVQEKTEISVQ